MTLSFVIQVMVFAFFSCTLGCSMSHTKQIPTADFTKNTKIAEIKLRSGELITFDSQGGQLIKADHVIYGITSAGQRAITDANYLKEAYDSNMHLLTEMELRSSPEVIISKIITKKNFLIQFNDQGGKYVDHFEAFVGKFNGKEMVIPIETIDYGQIRSSSPGGILMGVTLVLVFIVAVSLLTLTISFSPGI